MTYCQKCGTDNGDEATFCKRCGSPLDVTPKCPRCGAEASEDSAFCQRCGARIVKYEPIVEEVPEPEPVVEPQVDDEKSSPSDVTNIPQKNNGIYRTQYETVVESVVIEPTDYVRSKRYGCIACSILGGIALIAVMFLVPFDFTMNAYGSIDLRTESMTLFDAAMDSNDSILKALAILTILFGILGIVSSNLAYFGVFAFMILGYMMGMMPFEIEGDLITMTYRAADPVISMLTVLAIMLVVAAILFISDVFKAKAVNINGIVMERSTSVRYGGFIFNVDPKWNQVTRKYYKMEL